MQLLEALFPTTIDRLEPAKGQQAGPRPERVKDRLSEPRLSSGRTLGSC